MNNNIRNTTEKKNIGISNKLSSTWNRLYPLNYMSVTFCIKNAILDLRNTSRKKKGTSQS